MSMQDWTTTNIGRSSIKKEIKKLQNPETSRIKKLENESETFHHKYVSKELSKNIIIARTAKNLSRIELAKRCNITVADLALIENGKAFKNDPNIQKIRRYLNLSL